MTPIKKQEMIKLIQLREKDLKNKLTKSRELYYEVKNQNVGPGTLASYEYIYYSTRTAWVEVRDLMKAMGIDTLRYKWWKENKNDSNIDEIKGEAEE